MSHFQSAAHAVVKGDLEKLRVLVAGNPKLEVRSGSGGGGAPKEQCRAGCRTAGIYQSAHW